MSKEVKEPAVRMIKRDTISTAKAWGNPACSRCIITDRCGTCDRCNHKTESDSGISWYYRRCGRKQPSCVGNDPRDIGAFMYCDRTDTGI